jgi:hypothetical protein
MLAAKLVSLIEGHWKNRVDDHQETPPDRAFEHIGGLPIPSFWNGAKAYCQPEPLDPEGARPKSPNATSTWQTAVPRRRAIARSRARLQILKDIMVEFVRNQASATRPSRFMPRELEHSVGKFFDCLVYHLVHATKPSSARWRT